MTVDAVIAGAYHGFVAWMVVVMVRNLIRSKSWERELLYVVVLLGFVLRLLHLK